MSDRICSICRGATAVGCEFCNPTLGASVTHTESLEDGLRDVGEVHDSWNASDEFKKGWAACREQFRELLDSINNPDSDSKVSTLIDQEND